MRKLIASINVSIDGFCDHMKMGANEEIHRYFTEVLKGAGAMLYGRTTYELMEDYWPTLVKNPSGEKDMDDFAMAIHNVPKILFSTTRKSVSWENTRLATMSLKEEALALKQQSGNDVFVGSPGLISQLTNLGLIDEWHLVVHPVIVGSGLRLFKDVKDNIGMKLVSSKTFGSPGHMLLCYQPE